MQVERLRLTGFKSFVEPTELAIEPGLTGIVGPNGCGKSNLVEALRWVMGEGSAKRLRGGEMDDVIFAGSGSRPPHHPRRGFVLPHQWPRCARPRRPVAVRGRRDGPAFGCVGQPGPGRRA